MQKYKLDECAVVVQGSSLSPAEAVTVPKELVADLNMELQIDNKGFVIRGRMFGMFLCFWIVWLFLYW